MLLFGYTISIAIYLKIQYLYLAECRTINIIYKCTCNVPIKFIVHILCTGYICLLCLWFLLSLLEWVHSIPFRCISPFWHSFWYYFRHHNHFHYKNNNNNNKQQHFVRMRKCARARVRWYSAIMIMYMTLCICCAGSHCRCAESILFGIA